MYRASVNINGQAKPDSHLVALQRQGHRALVCPSLHLQALKPVGQADRQLHQSL